MLIFQLVGHVKEAEFVINCLEIMNWSKTKNNFSLDLGSAFSGTQEFIDSMNRVHDNLLMVFISSPMKLDMEGSKYGLVQIGTQSWVSFPRYWLTIV